jgi:glutathione synthase/RimK-type ligase-like ATP-grasp enzyme
LVKLSILATKIVDINLCSVDIALVNNKFKVVEINGGIMMEGFSKTSKKNYDKAVGIYEKIVRKMFSL